MKTRRNPKHALRRSRRSKKGGFGGWPRTTTVGPAWNGQNGGNHFKFGTNGIVVGGIQPAVPEMNGPGMHQTNRLYPPLSQKSLSMGGGSKRGRGSSRSHKKGRSRRGGALALGGLIDNARIAWGNATVGAENAYRAYMGLKPLEPASPWVQPALSSSKMPNTHAPKPYVIDAARSMQKH